MDRFYDKAKAVEAIEQLIKERCEKDIKHLSRIPKDPEVLDGVSVEKDDTENVWRLVRDDNDGGREELVFMATGAIISKDLPPIALSNNKIRFLSQYIQLSGMGSTEFDNTIVALKGLQQLGEREFQEGEVKEWTQLTMQGQDTIKFLNHYFMPCSQTIEGDSIPFPIDVDPNGVLQRLAGMQWIHAEDNEVRYYRGVMNGGKKRYIVAKPQTFRVGDIVKVQTSMVFVKDKRGRVKMKTILRAIAMVNCDISMRADRERKQAVAGMAIMSLSRMKRKIGFEEDEKEEEMDHRAKRREEETPEETMAE
ncbi:hypothetical protein IW261DRAFT_1565805 [Armillaria novae-zelandiae]|uniref:Uncharacterized protein n=1 Tax=Armillaria novae-zelandiae TaxID=153914 RepID=A0AA39P4N2_9AGAR|nr:hypothetical protein IW261DRAFT_1565805 [Armillaria novae-zelandiae]